MLFTVDKFVKTKKKKEKRKKYVSPVVNAINLSETILDKYPVIHVPHERTA